MPEPSDHDTLPSDDKPTDVGGGDATHEDCYDTQSLPAAWSFAPQQQRFTVLRMHQQGGLGRLMIAKDGELNREIALKEILPNYADNDETRRRFIREAEITGALEHPGVVPVYSLGEFADGRPFYAMRLIRGVDLRTALEDFHNRPGTLAQKWFEFRQLLGRFVSVCQAIDYAHNRRVLHRDIKPGNIMLGDFGETLIVDWGLARTIDDPDAAPDLDSEPIQPTQRASADRTQQGRIVGTLAYVSPEQAQGRMDLMQPASDIYGLGATLYHVLTGVPPFNASDASVLVDIRSGRFPPPRQLNKDIPKALEAICLKAMARQPQDRYASARDLGLDVERYLGDERVHAYSEPVVGQAWRWIRRHRTAVMSFMAAAVVAVAALTAGVVLLTAANRREREAKDRARQNYKESVTQRDRAEHNFRLAQDAVRDYFTRVSEETLLNQPGMQPLRKSLLREALPYYQEFLAQRKDDPNLRKEVAQAEYSIGGITEAITSPDAALGHYRAAADLQKQLVAEGEADESESTAYAQTLNAIGRALQRLGRRDEARDYYRQATEVRGKLAAAKPTDPDIARAYASSIMNLGVLDYDAGNAESALPQLERAQAIRLAHTGWLDASSRQFIRDVGKGYYNIALARLQLGESMRAESSLFKAIESFEKLYELEPNDLVNRHQLANCRRMIADAKTAKEEPDENDLLAAVELYEQARGELQELALRNPDVPEFAADLAGVRMNLGAQWQATGKPQQALDELLVAAEQLQSLVQQHSGVPRYQRDLGVSLRAAGQVLAELDRRDEARERLDESKKVLEDLVREHPEDEQYAKDLQSTIEALEELAAI